MFVCCRLISEMLMIRFGNDQKHSMQMCVNCVRNTQIQKRTVNVNMHFTYCDVCLGFFISLTFSTKNKKKHPLPNGGGPRFSKFTHDPLLIVILSTFFPHLAYLAGMFCFFFLHLQLPICSPLKRMVM